MRCPRIKSNVCFAQRRKRFVDRQQIDRTCDGEGLKFTAPFILCKTFGQIKVSENERVNATANLHARYALGEILCA